MLVSMGTATLEKAFITGKGAPELDLSADDLRGIVEDALTEIAPNSRVLAVVPDKTRDDTTDLLFPFAAEILAEKKVERFDALVAQGTHAPMSSAEKRAKIDVGDGENIPKLGSVFDHH